MICGVVSDVWWCVMCGGVYDVCWCVMRCGIRDKVCVCACGDAIDAGEWCMCVLFRWYAPFSIVFQTKTHHTTSHHATHYTTTPHHTTHDIIHSILHYTTHYITHYNTPLTPSSVPTHVVWIYMQRYQKSLPALSHNFNALERFVMS